MSEASKQAIPPSPQLTFIEKAKSGERLAIVTPEELKADLEIILPSEKKNLIKEIYELAKAVEPMAYLTPARKTSDERDENGEFVEAPYEVEGRGIYQSQIMVNGQEITLYLKGNGSVARSLSYGHSRDSLLPAFPVGVTTPDKFYHEKPTDGRLNMRIVGTQARKAALNEYIQTLLGFSSYLHAHPEINTLQEVLTSEIPFPLTVTSLPELSSRLQETKEILMSKEKREKVKEAMNNDEGTNLSTLVLCVPSSKRYPVIETYYSPEKNLTSLASLKEVDYRNMGIVLRELLREQMIHTAGSTHGQNLYRFTNSRFGVADFADVVMFEQLKDCEQAVDRMGNIGTLTRSQAGKAILFDLLTAERGMTPLAFVTHFRRQDVRDYNSRQMATNQKIFFSEFFADLMQKNVLNKEALENMAVLLPIFNYEFAFVVSDLLWEFYAKDTPETEERQLKRSLLIEKYSKFEPSLPEYMTVNDPKPKVQFLSEEYLEMKKLPSIRAVRQYLETGDLTALAEIADEDFLKKINFALALWQMPEGPKKEHIFAQVSDIYIIGRQWQEGLPVEKNPDLMYSMSELHIAKVTGLIREGKFEEAELFLEVTGTLLKLSSGKRSPRLDMPPEGLESPFHYYSMLLFSAQTKEELNAIKNEVYLRERFGVGFRFMHENLPQKSLAGYREHEQVIPYWGYLWDSLYSQFSKEDFLRVSERLHAFYIYCDTYLDKKIDTEAFLDGLREYGDLETSPEMKLFLSLYVWAVRERHSPLTDEIRSGYAEILNSFYREELPVRAREFFVDTNWLFTFDPAKEQSLITNKFELLKRKYSQEFPRVVRFYELRVERMLGDIAKQL